jgi:hypothetical protein
VLGDGLEAEGDDVAPLVGGDDVVGVPAFRRRLLRALRRAVLIT